MNKGFTLIELLVVIAIVAILSVAVILALNPTQLLAQARDSNRVNDLNTVKNAISMYIASTSTAPSLGTPNACVSSLAVAPAGNCLNRYKALTGATYTLAATPSAVNSSGWVPINMTGMTGGAPLGALPLDPTNSGNYYYTYGTDGTSFELTALLESNKYATSTSAGGYGNGTTSATYAAGTSIAL